MPADPYHARITDDIRRRIASGEWRRGERIPSTAALLDMYRTMFGVRSASTVRRVVDTLIVLGELRGEAGRAVFVAEDAPGAPQTG